MSQIIKKYRSQSLFLFLALITILTLVFTSNYLNRRKSHSTLSPAASGTCPSELPPYPSYVYLYRNADKEEAECRKISEERSSSHTEKECPDLFIIGARKGGTTSLYQYISQHPGFKGQGLDRGLGAGEIHYFSFTFMERSWEEYTGRFGDREGRMSGESSVSYLTSCMAPFRLRAMCGLAPKIVVLLREPIARMVSNYAMRYHVRGRKEGLDTYVRDSIEKDLDAWEKVFLENNIRIDELLQSSNLCLFKPARNMIYEGMYSLHLRRWFEYFPRENFILWRTEDFREQSSGYLTQLTARLGLTEVDRKWADEITSPRYNQYEYNITQVLRKEDRETLQKIFKPFNKQLQVMLGKEYSW